MTYRQWLLRCLSRDWQCGIMIVIFAGLLFSTDALAGQTVHTYDAQNRLVRTDYSDGSSTAFTYNAVGQLTQVTDSISGTIEFQYDNIGRLNQTTTAQGTIRYTYDVLGRRSSMTVNGGQPITYQYDPASRLTQVAQGNKIVGIGYDAGGRRTNLTYSNGTSVQYSYDAASRVISIIHQGPGGIIEQVTYSYDSQGNRLSAIRTGSPSTQLPSTAQAAYDSANEQIQFNSTTPNLTYDANGNLLSHSDTAGTTSYDWNVRNQLIGLTGPGINASFQYDAFGRRVGKTVNGVTTQYLYDGRDIVAEIQSGSVSATYVRSLDIDEPFIWQSIGTSEYYHADALGSVLALTNESGAALATYRYEAFGKTAIMGVSSNPFQYTGREHDETGLYYYRARYYSPVFSRFLNEDPTGIGSGDPNLYVYVFNNPTNRVDPTGQIAPALPALPALVEMLTTVGGLVSSQVLPIVGATTIIGVGALPGDVLRRDQFDDIIAKAPAPPYPQIKDLKQDCAPGRRLVEPSTSVKGGTSIEQEYICKSGVHTRHTIIDKKGKIVHDHFRPGPPKGGGGD